MTQPDATNTPARRPTGTLRPAPRLGTGTTVTSSLSNETGKVVESDEFMDTLQLRGVPISAQVLVEWERDGNPLRTWELVSTLG